MKANTWKGYLLAVLLVALMSRYFATAQAEPFNPASLESRVSALESKVPSHADEAVLLVLFGAFSALWAQNTGRNAWLWFFVGMFFNIITVMVLLYKNSQDKLRPGS